MFGYVTPLKRELKIREYELYRAVYCGLCRQMGKRFGQTARLTLSYDFVFLVMIVETASGNDGELFSGRCPLHPFKKRLLLKDSEALSYGAALGALLSWHKADDNVRDEKGLKSFGARLLKAALTPAYKKAARLYPKAEDRIEKSISDLSHLEEQNNATLDLPADTFASLLGDLVGQGITDGVQKRVAVRMGQSLGRFIYILDAFCDIKEDGEKGSYNPLFGRFNRAEGEEAQAFSERIAGDVEFTLIQSLSDLQSSLALLPEGAYTGILDNIVRGGLYLRTRLLIYGKGEGKDGPL